MILLESSNYSLTSVDDLIKSFEKDTSKIKRKSNVSQFFTDLLSTVDFQTDKGRYLYEDGKFTFTKNDPLTSEQKANQVSAKMDEIKDFFDNFSFNRSQKYLYPVLGLSAVLLLLTLRK